MKYFLETLKSTLSCIAYFECLCCLVNKQDIHVKWNSPGIWTQNSNLPWGWVFFWEGYVNYFLVGFYHSLFVSDRCLEIEV